MGAALRLGLTVTALGAAAIGLGASLLSGMGSERFASFVVAGALAAVGALGFLVLRVIADALKGWGRVTVALALESYGVPVGVLAGIALGLILVGAESIGPRAAVGSHLAALAGTAALLAWVWRRVSRGSGGVAIRLRDRRLARFWGLGMLGGVTTNLPVVVAPLFAEAAGVGRFTVAFRLVGLVTMVLMTLAAWFGPRFAAAAGDPKRLRWDLLSSQGLSLVVAAPALGVFLAVPGEVMALFGSDFRAGAGLLTILIMGQIVNAGTGLAGYLLQMAGHERAEFRIDLVDAALFSVTLHHLIRVGPQDDEATLAAPADVVTWLNGRFVGAETGDRYFTRVYGVLDPATGVGRFCQAGHPGPIRVAADGSVHELGQGAFPVGLLEEAAYTDYTLQLAPGDRLVLCSDGVLEAENPTGQPFGRRAYTSTWCTAVMHRPKG